MRASRTQTKDFMYSEKNKHETGAMHFLAKIAPRTDNESRTKLAAAKPTKAKLPVQCHILTYTNNTTANSVGHSGSNGSCSLGPQLICGTCDFVIIWFVCDGRKIIWKLSR